jgi:hypothetical protein
MDYYQVDIRNLTFAELLRIFKLGFPVGALCKILRIPFPMRTVIAYPVRILRVDESELDVDGRRSRLRRDFVELTQGGMHYQFLFKVPIVSPDTTSIALAFLSEDRTIYGSIVDSVTRLGSKTQRMSLISFLTPMTDGRFTATLSRRLFNEPPEYQVENVRGRAAKILQRHRERLRSSVAGSKTINTDELESFITNHESRAFEYQRQRGVWLRAPASKVEKLRHGKPRGKLWQKAVGWAMSAIVAAVVWATAGLWSCPGMPGEDEVAIELWAGETQVVLACETLAPEQTDTIGVEPQVATVVGIFSSTESAAAMHESTRSFLEEQGAPPGTLDQIGNVLLFRTTEGVKRDAKPVYDAWHEASEEVAVLGGSVNERDLELVVSWRLPPGEQSDRAASIESCLEAEMSAPLRPPWAILPDGQRAVTDEQENARRTLRKIRGDEYLDLEMLTPGVMGMIKMIWRGVTWDVEDWQNEMKAEQQRRIAKLEALADQLRSEDPTLDTEVLELYVQWQTEIGEDIYPGPDGQDPFAEEPDPADIFSGQRSETLLRLQERLGALHEAVNTETGVAEVDDPLAPYSTDFGWIEQRDEEVGMRVYLSDPAVAVPAILRYLCEEEAVSEVTVGFSANQW